MKQTKQPGQQMDYKDYYQILGVDRNASTDDIKKSYRKLARKYHPDVSKEADAEAKFKDVQEAYGVLKDAEKRKAYDQLGANWKNGQGFEPPPGWEFHGGAGGNGGPHTQEFTGDFSDFFENLFGGGRARGHAGRGRAHAFKQRGQDQQSKVTISLQDAFRGTERVLNLQEQVMDPQTGQVKLNKRSLKIKIPAGVSEGQQIRLAGQGSPGMGGGPNGDLFLEIHIQPHPFFTLDKKNIHLNLPIAPWEAALGATVEVPTLGGKIHLKIPAQSQSGKKMRLKGRGLPGKTTGDQLVTLRIVIPEPKSDEDRALYEKMAQDMKFDPRQALTGV